MAVLMWLVLRPALKWFPCSEDRYEESNTVISCLGLHSFPSRCMSAKALDATLAWSPGLQWFCWSSGTKDCRDSLMCSRMNVVWCLFPTSNSKSREFVTSQASSGEGLLGFNFDISKMSVSPVLGVHVTGDLIYSREHASNIDCEKVCLTNLSKISACHYAITALS